MSKGRLSPKPRENPCPHVFSENGAGVTRHAETDRHPVRAIFQSLPAGYAHELSADLLSYQEHLAHGTPVGLVLNYHNLNHALEIPSLTAQGGRARSHVVVWGGDLLQALHREYAFAHGHPRNGKIQKVKDELVAVNFCDPQMADLLWRGAWPGGVAELAHLNGATAGDDCRLMYQHLRRLLQRPRRAAGSSRPAASCFCLPRRCAAVLRHGRRAVGGHPRRARRLEIQPRSFHPDRRLPAPP
ncbi:hypothetical protein ACSDR0_47395 [Streptosporangium sp. G11]|uniref:hypothetical protein n=1 Tax=Streptosporangium sp. G11 TaxID=3436926 RepID=UPI003EBBB5B3